jgi:ribosome-binding protein aMBF1 (putative translation factor)
MKTKATTGPTFRTLGGRRVVVLEPAEYERLRQKADEWEPLLPAPDANGNYPAVEALRVSLARKIIRHRRRVGLTQRELARRAGIRPETLNRIEHAVKTPSVATIEKLERALQEAEKANGRE